jgi:ribonuclease G
MVKKQIVFSSTTTQKRAALLEDSKVVELVVEQPDNNRILGNIYRGRIDKIVPGIQSAFVDIGLGMSAFLHISDVDPALLPAPEEGDKGSERYEEFLNKSTRDKRRKIARVPIETVLTEGQQVIVQITKEPIADKSPKVTTQISLAGRFVVLVPDSDLIGVSKKSDDEANRKKIKRMVREMLPKGLGCIVRTIGLKVPEDHIRNELEALVDSWERVKKEAVSGAGPKTLYSERGITTQVIRDLFAEDVAEVIADTEDDYDEIVSYLEQIAPAMVDRVAFYQSEIPLFDAFDVERELDKSIKRKVWMKSGGYLYFDHAEALLAIDVNTGRNTGKNNLEETVFKTNMESCYEIARQLRLRDIGGIIVVDFIDMRNAKNRKKIEDKMEELLDIDSTTTSFTSLSKFGLMEITRKRVRPELQELLTDVCPSCYGLGRVFSLATVASRIDRWLHRAEKGELPKHLTLSVARSISDYLLKDDAKISKELEAAHGYQLRINVNGNLDPDEFEFFKMGSSEPIAEKHK